MTIVATSMWFISCPRLDHRPRSRSNCCEANPLQAGLKWQSNTYAPNFRQSWTLDILNPKWKRTCPAIADARLNHPGWSWRSSVPFHPPGDSSTWRRRFYTGPFDHQLSILSWAITSTIELWWWMKFSLNMMCSLTLTRSRKKNLLSPENYCEIVKLHAIPDWEKRIMMIMRGSRDEMTCADAQQFLLCFFFAAPFWSIAWLPSYLRDNKFIFFSRVGVTYDGEVSWVHYTRVYLVLRPQKVKRLVNCLMIHARADKSLHKFRWFKDSKSRLKNQKSAFGSLPKFHARTEARTLILSYQGPRLTAGRLWHPIIDDQCTGHLHERYPGEPGQQVWHATSGITSLGISLLYQWKATISSGFLMVRFRLF